MVQVIDDPFSGNIFGRIGKGIGKGLSEQIPKEIQQQRLASGLKRFAQESEGLTPLESFTKLASIPGMSPDILYTARPLLERQQQTSAFRRRTGARGEGLGGKGAGVARGGGQGISPGMQPESQAEYGLPGNDLEPGAAHPSTGFLSPREIEEDKKRLLKPATQAQIDSLANDYLDSGETFDIAEAKKMAEAEFEQTRKAQQTQNKGFRDLMQERFKTVLQGSGLNDFSEIKGEMTQALLDQGEAMMRRDGLSPEAAAQRMSNIALELAKSSNKLKEMGSFMGMFTPSKNKISDLQVQKKQFEKYGFGELFDDLAASSLGITPMQAAHVLDPVKSGALKKELEGIKTKGPKGTVSELSDQKLDNIIKSITPKDNISDIEYYLREKGADLSQFKRRILELSDENKIALTPRQRRQLERKTEQSYLGDILFQVL